MSIAMQQQQLDNFAEGQYHESHIIAIESYTMQSSQSVHPRPSNMVYCSLSTNPIISAVYVLILKCPMIRKIFLKF